MKKSLFLCIVTTLLLTGCHSHQYSNATCELPKTCSECGDTEGEPLEHIFSEASCTTPKTCSLCGETDGNTLDHFMSVATCEAPITCSNCGETKGEPLDHAWVDATCKAPKTCFLCDKTEGELADHTWTDATFEAPKTCSVCSKTEGSVLSVAAFESQLREMPMYVESTRYIVQDTKYKSLYPDMLSATVKNNSGKSIKNAVVAFVAWDNNNFPIKIYGEYDYYGSYVKKCNYQDANMVNGSTYGGDRGMAIDYSDTGTIATFKAIVVEYTDFDGNTWKNPYYDAWLGLYEDKILK